MGPRGAEDTGKSMCRQIPKAYFSTLQGRLARRLGMPLSKHNRLRH